MNYNKFQENKPFELSNVRPIVYPSIPQINYAPTRKINHTENKSISSTSINFVQDPTYNNYNTPAYINIYPSQPLIYQTPIPIYYPILNQQQQQQQQPQQLQQQQQQQQQPKQQQQPSYNPTFMYYPNQGMTTARERSGSNVISKPIPKLTKKNYYNEKLSDSWMRTPIVGAYKEGSLEFDDYYEKLHSMFLTPELDEIKIWHTNDYLWGIQIIFRDSWGKDKEYYKGNPHLGRNQSQNNFLLSSFKLSYDDNIIEIRGSEGSVITGLYIKTFLGREFKVGKLDNLGGNLVQPLTKAVAVGGSHNGLCIEHLYFYMI